MSVRPIIRTLRDPAKWPESALAVGAALPDGDPLQTALKRGVTPLPEEVGEMGQREAMNPGRAAALAKAGRFSEAVETAKRARDLALRAGRADVAGPIAERLALYEAERSYRSPRP